MSSGRQLFDGKIVRRQGRALWLAEFTRPPRELAAFAVPALGPCGGGHPVLVPPGRPAMAPA